MQKQIEEMARDFCIPEQDAEIMYRVYGYRKQVWHKASDELPETSGSYIVCTNKWSVCTAHYYADAKKFSAPCGKNAVYWTCLPEPPKGE